MLKQLMRTHFWIVFLAFLFSASYLLAQTTTQAARMWISPTSSYRLPRMIHDNGPTEADTQLQAQFAILNQTNLFDPDKKPLTPPPPKRRKAPPKDKNIKHTDCDPNASYRPSNLPLQLKGTAIASDPSYSVAAIFDSQRRQNVIVRVGDLYRGIKVCAIEKQDKPAGLHDGDKKFAFFIKLDRGQGRFEFLESGRPPGTGRSSHISDMYKQYSSLRRQNLDLKDIKKTGNDQFVVKRDLLNTLTNRLDWVASQAAIVPFFSRGQAAGFRITHMRHNSLYQKLGLKNGDVIQRINGYDLTSPQKALEAYSNLMSAGQLSVEILRGGKAKSVSYEIKE